MLDGRRRLAFSLRSFLGPEIEQTDDTSWTNIYYDIAAATDLQDTEFRALHDDEVDLDRHFPIGTFFDVPAYRKATQRFSDEIADKIGGVQAIFQQAIIPVQLVETDDRSKVAIVFERVNKRGMELDILQLLSAWTWSEDFDLQSRFNQLSEDLGPLGFHGVGRDSNLLLRCCAAVVAEDVSAGKLIALKGADVRDRFSEVVNGIKGAIDFLRNTLKVETLDNLPYPALLVPLTVFLRYPQWPQCQNDRYATQIPYSMVLALLLLTAI